MNYFDDIRITYVGKAFTNANNPPLSEKHDREFYGIGIMLGKDSVCRTIYPDNEKVITKMPFLYTVHPNFQGTWQSVNGSFRENRWFLFEGSRGIRMLDALLENMNICSCIMPLKGFSELVNIHQKMLYLFQSGIPARNHQLAVCAENFMGAIYDSMNIPEMKPPIIQVISDLIKEMTENPGNSYDFKKIAAQHKISYYHFRRCFIQYTQIPIHEFLLQKRFALATDLLKNGQDSVKEIADRCGFRTSSDFSRFVKERSGTTPSELRQQSNFTEV